MAGLLDILQAMCARGFLRQVTRLCVASKELGEVAPMGTARQIYDASRDGQVAALETFLAYWEGSSESPHVLNWQSRDGCASLQAAVRWNRLACVKLLAGAAPYVNVDKYGDDDMSALHIACKLGYDEIVRVLIAVPGIDINTLTPPKLQTPLHVAAYHGHAEVVRILVSRKGIKIHRYDWESADALDCAGDEEVIAIIEEAIAKQCVMDAKGRELCRAAYDCNLMELARLIDKYRDDEDVLNWVFPEDGAECYARGEPESDDEDDDAREERENFNDDSSELTPVLVAAKGGHKEAVRMLLANPRVNPHIVDKDGRNILMLAALNDDHEMLRLVLSTVPDIDVNKTATDYRKDKFTVMDLVGHPYRHINREDIVATLRAAGAKTAAELKAESEL